MGKTDRSTWKKRETQAAALFGARRQRCSGSSGRDDLSRSDSTHPRLFLEVKLQASTPLRNKLDDARRQYRQTTILDATSHIMHPTMLAVHSEDLDEVLKDIDAVQMLDPGQRHKAVSNLLQATEAHALREGKTAVVLIATKGRPGFLVAFRLANLAKLREERLIALGQKFDTGAGEAA